MFGSNISKPRRNLRKRRLELPLEELRHAERQVRPDETGRIVKPFGHAHRLLGKMLGLLQLEQVQMVEHQAAEHCEPPGVIPDLPSELQRPGIGSAEVGVAMAFGREQGGCQVVLIQGKPGSASPVCWKR
jgi:hypothetical protein